MSIASWASFGLFGRPKVQPEAPAPAACTCACKQTPTSNAAPSPFASVDVVVVPPPGSTPPTRIASPAAVEAVAPPGARREGTVKWFNVTKGYGFVQPADGSRDLFVHISAVERAGLTDLREGQRITFSVSNDRSKLSAENLELVPECKATKLALPEGTQLGVVKWYNPVKGYGFIKPADGDRDVFLHISAVERAGLSKVSEGQSVSFRLHTIRGKSSAEDLAVH